MIANLTQFLSDDSGATMVEYGLMVSLIAMVALLAVKGIGTGLNTLFTNVGNSL